MKRSSHLAGKRLLLVIFAVAPAFSQAISMPAWLAAYPGATPAVRSSDSLIESSYTIAAQPEDIVRHYRKLFEAAALPFQPNGDGIGTSIRASAPECDLLIQIRSRQEGSFVDVNCSAKSESATPASAADVRILTPSRPQTPAKPGVQARPPSASPLGPRTPPPPPMSADEMIAQQHKIAAEMGLHRVHPDAPAPPLVWPSWLVHVNGGTLRTERGLNYAKDAMLKAAYVTNVPMTELYSFYRELLMEHEYPTQSSISTGQTLTGIQQNAIGYVEGFNYPDGAPGAYTTIHVSFDRSVLNGPITVSLQFTTHEFISKRGY